MLLVREESGRAVLLIMSSFIPANGLIFAKKIDVAFELFDVVTRPSFSKRGGVVNGVEFDRF